MSIAKFTLLVLSSTIILWSIQTEAKTKKREGRIRNFNILFITIDSLRPDKLSCYGSSKKTSPNIDSLAEEGIVFTNAWANSGWTSPSLVSIFSALFPTSHGVETRGFVISESFITPVEILQKYKYNTYAEHWTGDTIGNLGFQFGGTSVIEFLEKHKQENFFAWFHLRGPHLPYNPPEEYVREFAQNLTVGLERVRPILEKKIIERNKYEFQLSAEEISFIHALYEAEVRLQDEEIGGIISKLKELDLWERTIIVITADHGEELFEHGWIGHASTSLDSPLYLEILKIPLIVRIPGFRKKVIDYPVMQVDIMPILFEIIGIEIPVDTQRIYDGFSPIRFEGGKVRLKRGIPKRRYIFASSSPCGWQCKKDEMWKRIYAVSDGEYKLMYYNYTGKTTLPRFELLYIPQNVENQEMVNQEKFSELLNKLSEFIINSKSKNFLFKLTSPLIDEQ